VSETGQPTVQVFSDLGDLSRAAATGIVAVVAEAVATYGRCALALAGGSTPRTLYQLLAREHSDAIPWERVLVFFGDERCVPPDDPASNYGMARSELLSRVPIPDAQVHRIRGEMPRTTEAVRYEALLRRETARAAGDAQTFDLALLGVGPDGHTVSLFPGQPAVEERERWVLPVDAPTGISPPERITLTLPALNRAREVWLLCAGAEKRAVTEAMLDRVDESLPAARVRGRDRTIWYLDRQAAGDA
jgi:6-phosphogluconolactonase